MSESEEMKRLWKLIKERGLEDAFMGEMIRALERHENRIRFLEGVVEGILERLK